MEKNYRYSGFDTKNMFMGNSKSDITKEILEEIDEITKIVMIKLTKKPNYYLLPHREPMLLIDELYDIKKLFSATAVVNVKIVFLYKDYFPINQLCQVLF